MDINDFCLKAIEIAEVRFGALEIAKCVLKQYARGQTRSSDQALDALLRIEQLEREIGQ